MPAIWEMVKEAAAAIGREATYAEIKTRVRAAYGDINESSLTCAIIASSVNHPSRIHYQENKKPRIAMGEHDFLFNTGRGRVAPYVSSTHGTWEIFEKEDGQFGIRLVETVDEPAEPVEGEASAERSLFALESHLRDYLAKNLAKVNVTGKKLSAFVSEDGRDGVEFQTDVGPIDILARDEQGQFVVIELKLGRGPDASLGQILRYMGWVEKHLSRGSPVRGIIIASDIPLKLRYAVTQVPSVTLMEYELSFNLNSVVL